MRLGLILAILVLPTVAWCQTVGQTFKDLQISYTEPTENADGTPLAALKHTTITGTINGVDIGVITKNATSLNGGGAISHTFVDACPPNSLPPVSFTVTATDLVDNESEPVSLAMIMDCLPPGKVK